MVIPATSFKDLTRNKKNFVLCNVLNSTKIISVRGPIKLHQIFCKLSNTSLNVKDLTVML